MTHYSVKFYKIAINYERSDDIYYERRKLNFKSERIGEVVMYMT